MLGVKMPEKIEPIKFDYITARDIPEAWFRCVRWVMKRGREYRADRGDWTGHERREIDIFTIRVKQPWLRPRLPDFKSLGIDLGSPPGWADNEGMIFLMTDQRQTGEEYTYGQDLESQIKEVIRIYREYGPYTNQCCMTIGNKDSIFLRQPQYLRSVDCHVRNNRLHFVAYTRSVDLWSAFPEVLAILQNLKEYMAAEIGIEDGQLIYMGKGMHLHDWCWEQARIISTGAMGRKVVFED